MELEELRLYIKFDLSEDCGQKSIRTLLPSEFSRANGFL